MLYVAFMGGRKFSHFLNAIHVHIHSGIIHARAGAHRQTACRYTACTCAQLSMRAHSGIINEEDIGIIETFVEGIFTEGDPIVVSSCAKSLALISR